MELRVTLKEPEENTGTLKSEFRPVVAEPLEVRVVIVQRTVSPMFTAVLSETAPLHMIVDLVDGFPYTGNDVDKVPPVVRGTLTTNDTV